MNMKIHVFYLAALAILAACNNSDNKTVTETETAPTAHKTELKLPGGFSATIVAD